MDDPQAIAGRIGDIAKAAVNTSADIALTAFRQINQVPDNGRTPPPYTPANAVTSMNKLVTAMLDAGIAMVRVPLRVSYDQNMMTLADNVASVVGRGITQAAQVAGTAAESVEQNGGLKKQTALDSAIKLTNIAMLRTAEIAEAIAAGPGLYRDPVLHSDPFTVAGDGTVRQLKLLSMARTDTGEDITAQVWFDPANGVLMPGTTQFRLVANSAGLPSGVYCGQVEMTTTGATPVRTTIEVAFAL